jgi:tryptophan synthase alpha chain
VHEHPRALTSLRKHLERLRSSGRKALVPYLVGGIPDRDSWPAALEAISVEADAIEVGLPYSDPLMDGPVIAAAGERAIRAGVGPLDALALAGQCPAHVPRVAMTYYNPVHRVGEEEFCERAARASFSGLIVPDIPLEESEGLRKACAATGLAWIPLVAPTSPRHRIERICATSTGFVYAVSTLGVTGTRDELSERAAAVVAGCRAATDLPVLVGIGISTPAQACAAATEADGVVIGSAIVRRVLDEGAEAARAFLAGVRAALDASS